MKHSKSFAVAQPEGGSMEELRETALRLTSDSSFRESVYEIIARKDATNKTEDWEERERGERGETVLSFYLSPHSEWRRDPDPKPTGTITSMIVHRNLWLPSWEQFKWSWTLTKPLLNLFYGLKHFSTKLNSGTESCVSIASEKTWRLGKTISKYFFFPLTR